MATSSFDQKFTVRDKKVAAQLRNDLNKSKPANAVSASNSQMDREKAAQLLRRTYTS